MRVNIGDIRLFVDTEGFGLAPVGPTMVGRPTVILLHGGPGFDHSIFKPQMGAAISDIAQVLYYDHRGHGRSDRATPDTWNLDQWADDLVALCDVLGIEKPIVWGVSFGGFVALKYATRHPGHAARVIADSTAARMDVSKLLPVFERLGGPKARSIAETFWSAPDDAAMAAYMTKCMPLYNRTTAPDQADKMARSMSTFNADVFRWFLDNEQMSFDLRGDLARVTSRILLLSGQDDPVTPVAAAEEVAAAVPAHLLRFEQFANCGHGVMRDRSDAAGPIIREFIQGAA